MVTTSPRTEKESPMMEIQPRAFAYSYFSLNDCNRNANVLGILLEQ